MKSIARLKEQARAFEQQEAWDRAIAAYREALSAEQEQQGELDLPLFNRIGDLYLRLGRADDAVDQYEQAADHYADAGLYNNAIALCNKALRHAPGRPSVFRRLSRFCAAQGFVADARRWILEYAGKMNAAGRIEDAFEALEEFADLTSDPEIAEMLGRQFHAHGRQQEAVAQLRRADSLYLDAGRWDRADAVRELADSIAPAVEGDLEPIGGLAPEPPGEFPPAADQPAAAADTDDFEEPPSEEHELPIESAADAAGIGIDEQDAPEPEPLPLLDFEFEAPPEEEPEPKPESRLDDEHLPSAHLPEEAADHFSIDLPLENVGLENAADAAGLGDPDVEADALPETMDALPLLDEREMELADVEEAAFAPEDLAADDAVREPLPLVDDTDTRSLEPPSAPEVEVAPTLARARQVLARGDRRGALDMLHRLHETLAAQGRLEEAVGVLGEMTVMDARDLSLYQQKVEYASRSRSQPLLIGAYLDMAGALERLGSRARARSVLERVLELDPQNARARDALHGGASVRANEFVDLAGFLDEEPEEVIEPSTRFVVPAQAPTGDDEADLAAMLSQFQAKVAENVGVEDASSHYDLGIAFKEMGLIDEAINEFQTALRGGEGRLKVFEELGHCFFEKGRYNIAIKVLSRALDLPRDDETELLGVYYHLGRSYEELGLREEAREAYERVVALDLRFRDVPERLARL